MLPVGLNTILSTIGLTFSDLLTRHKSLGLDSFINYPELNNEDCRVIKGADACEDIVFHKNLAYMVCSNVPDRSAWFPPSGKRNATARVVWKDPMFRYDIDSEKLVQIELEGIEELVTHGMAIYEFPDNPNKIHLFVVSHSLERSVVYIFSLEGTSTKAKLVKTVKNSLLVAPNDITPTGPLSFFASNDHKFRDGFMRDVEEITGPWKWANVVYCEGDNDSCKMVWKELTFANGLLYYPDDKMLLMADSWAGDLYVFKVTPNYDLTLLNRTHLNIGMDNITPLYNGNAMIAAFPDHDAISRSRINPGSPCAAMAMVFDKKTREVKPVFKENNLFPMMTVGTVDPSGKVFLGGGVRTKGILRCKVNDWQL